jgi:DNA-binding LacI/PurR family transcriptional regulator
MFFLSIPRDLYIVGFDNIAMAKWHNYELTTAAQTGPKMAQVAVDLLLKSIRDNAQDTVTLKMKTDLLIRSSTRG